jgi:hypothetical protein
MTVKAEDDSGDKSGEKGMKLRTLETGADERYRSRCQKDHSL